MHPREGASESSATPASLLACARAGSPDCWDRLVQLYAPLVWHWCRTSGLQTEDQADVIQEVFQAVAGRLDRFQRGSAGSFRAWLRTVTRHKICDAHRRRQKEPAGTGGSDAQRWFSEVPAPEGEDDSRVEPAERDLLVRQALALLRPHFTEQTWQAFWRTAVEGCQTQDAAEALGMSPGAVRVARCRVLKRLREELHGLM